MRRILTVCTWFTLALWFSTGVTDDEIKRINRQLTRAPVTQGSFEQEKRLTFLNKPLRSTGIFGYDQNKGVVWKTATPVPSVLLIKDKQAWTPQGEQVLPEAFSRVFTALLSADFSRLSENFDMIGKAHHSAWQLQLIPKDVLVKKIITTVLLNGDAELRNVELKEANGNLTRIHFSEMSHPARLSIELQAEFERVPP